ncbi:MAG: ABC transporter substrate-binding protein [Chloroflexi bacterium]|nr:ABC transporter substrate-binding protein [Chloroflexota bacterium]
MFSGKLFTAPIVLLVGLLAACSTPATPTPAQPVLMRIGVLPITDVVPFYIAQQQGYFLKQGVAVELVPAASAAERDQMMATGQIDGQLNDLVSTVLFNAQTSKIKIVRIARIAFKNAPEYWILTSKDSPIKTAADLKGKEIAISQNSVIEYVTQRLLESEGLTAADIKTTNVPAIPTRLQLLTQNQVAAATLPDPLASLAILQGARIVVDDSKHTQYSMSVISFRNEALAQRAADIKRFLTAYDQAINDIRTKPDQFRNVLIEQGRVPDQLKDNYQFPPFPDPGLPTKEQWEDVVKWAMQKQLIKSAVTYESSVDTGFVK